MITAVSTSSRTGFIGERISPFFQALTQKVSSIWKQCVSFLERIFCCCRPKKPSPSINTDRVSLGLVPSNSRNGGGLVSPSSSTDQSSPHSSQTSRVSSAKGNVSTRKPFQRIPPDLTGVKVKNAPNGKLIDCQTAIGPVHNLVYHVGIHPKDDLARAIFRFSLDFLIGLPPVITQNRSRQGNKRFSKIGDFITVKLTTDIQEYLKSSVENKIQFERTIELPEDDHQFIDREISRKAQEFGIEPWIMENEYSNAGLSVEKFCSLIQLVDEGYGGVLLTGSNVEDLQCVAILKYGHSAYLLDTSHFIPMLEFSEFSDHEEFSKYVKGRVQGQPYYRFYPLFKLLPLEEMAEPPLT